MELCTEKGYGRVTVEAIAARAGVSKKTIYRWWPSKGAVLLEAFTEALVGATPFVDTGDIAADLRTHINSAVKLMSSPPYGPAYAGILSEMHHDDDLAVAVREQLVDPRVERAVGRLRRAQEQGQIPEGADLPLAVEMLYGPVYYRHVLRKAGSRTTRRSSRWWPMSCGRWAPGRNRPVRRDLRRPGRKGAARSRRDRRFPALGIPAPRGRTPRGPARTASAEEGLGPGQRRGVGQDVTGLAAVAQQYPAPPHPQVLTGDPQGARQRLGDRGIRVRECRDPTGSSPAIRCLKSTPGSLSQPDQWSR